MQSQILFELFSVPITDTLLFTWLTMIVIIVGSMLLTRNLAKIPKGVQHLVELAVEGIESMVVADLGSSGKKFVPLILTIALFVLIANLIGIFPGITSPTADLSTTSALAIIVLVIAHGNELKVKGIGGYIKDYFAPFWWMMPLNIISEFSKVLSHAFRLYGNIFGGGIIISIFYMFSPYVLPVPLMAWFGVFMGVIQTAVFTLLAIAYIQVRLQ